jgi:hypothetical protein
MDQVRLMREAGGFLGRAEVQALKVELAALKAAAGPVARWWKEMDEEGRYAFCTAKDIVQLDDFARLCGEG